MVKMKRLIIILLVLIFIPIAYAGIPRFLQLTQIGSFDMLANTNQSDKNWTFGNITASFFIGDGSSLTGISGTGSGNCSALNSCSNIFYSNNLTNVGAINRSVDLSSYPQRTELGIYLTNGTPANYSYNSSWASQTPCSGIQGAVSNLCTITSGGADASAWTSANNDTSAFLTQLALNLSRGDLNNITLISELSNDAGFLTSLSSFFNSFWNLGNSSAQGYLTNNSNANFTTLLVKTPPVECSSGFYMTYTNMTTSICADANESIDLSTYPQFTSSFFNSFFNKGNYSAEYASTGYKKENATADTGFQQISGVINTSSKLNIKGSERSVPLVNITNVGNGISDINSTALYIYSEGGYNTANVKGGHFIATKGANSGVNGNLYGVYVNATTDNALNSLSFNAYGGYFSAYANGTDRAYAGYFTASANSSANNAYGVYVKQGKSYFGGNVGI